MGISKVTDELVSTVRSVVGSEYSNMDIVRALHMANNDLTAAINIMFDTHSFRKPELSRNSEALSRNINQEPQSAVDNLNKNGNKNSQDLILSSSSNGSLKRRRENSERVKEEKLEDSRKFSSSGCSSSRGSEWWHVGCCELAGMSTSKGRSLHTGEEVIFTFPGEKKTLPSPRKSGSGRRQIGVCSEIVRFSTKACGEVGRIPNEWARCLLPLVRDNKVRIEGFCKSAPSILSIMDTINLSVSVYINGSMFRKGYQTSLKASGNDESVVHPLPTLFQLLGLSPFKKAEFTPCDLFPRKMPLHLEDSSNIPVSLLHITKLNNPSSLNVDKVENEESISDSDLDRIVGIADSSELEEMEPPATLQCELRPYQKQALHWMIQLERGNSMDEAGSTLHPCWNAYRLADKRGLVIYLNAFSGDATTEFPSTLQMARGGILADAMGLGKTIMTIALLLKHSDRDGSVGIQPTSQASIEDGGASMISDQSPTFFKKTTKISGFDKFFKRTNSLTSGGNLIICPVTLIGQWKSEIETHTQPGTLSLYVHYGQSRSKDVDILAQSDVVLTTYGVLTSEFSAEGLFLGCFLLLWI